MPIDLASVPAEDLLPVIALMERTPMEKRGEVTLRVQRAAREFLAKAEGAQRSAADAETDPVRKAVFGALAKQLPAPPPTLDPLRREALGTLVKAVTAGAKANLQKGLASAIGAKLGAKLGVGRAAGMRAMRAGAKSAKANTLARDGAGRAHQMDSAYASATRGMPASAARHGVGVKASKAAGEAWDRGTPDAIRSSGYAGAMRARGAFNEGVARKKRSAAIGVTAGAAAGGATYAIGSREKKGA